MEVVLRKRVEHKTGGDGTYRETVIYIEGEITVEGIRLRRGEKIYTDLTFDAKDRIERVQGAINTIIMDLINKAEVFKKSLAELKELLGDFEEVIS